MKPLMLGARQCIWNKSYKRTAKMKSNEEWSSQLCSLAQRVRAQTRHPLTKSFTKISKIRRSPRQENVRVASPKDKLEFKFSLSPLTSLTYCHTVSYRKLVWSKVLLTTIVDEFGCINSSAKIPHKITSYSIYKGYVFGKYCSMAITYSVCGFSW